MNLDSASIIKRPRQATACNWCRSHKLKCDAEQPSCRNCRKRGTECITTNLRRQGAKSQRVEPLGRHKKHNSKRSQAQQSEIPSSPSHPSIFVVPFNDITRQPQTPNDGPRQSAADASSQEPNSTATNLTLITDKSSLRQQMIGSGSSMYVLVQWLDLFHTKQDNWKAIFPYFQQSLAYSTEVPLLFPISRPSLPPPEETKQYISIFFNRIYPVFPILHQGSFFESVQHLRIKSTSQLDPKDYPVLACAYAVFSIAADEAVGHPTELGTQYLEGAYILYARIVAMPYLTSVQALLLLAIVLRNRSKDGASWGILGQAIRIAQSIGLHRHVSSTLETDDLHPQIWWTAYILERTMELETGRPSAIRDDECDQILPKTHALNVYFGGLIRLSKIQTRTLDLLYGDKNRRKSTREILLEIGRIDRALTDWANEFPESIKPGQQLFCDSEELHLATYLSIHYHQTIIALHRPVFLSAPAWLRDRIDEHCAGTPWGDRLRYSLCIGTTSARAILKALSDLLLYSKLSRIITVNQMVLAILVLAIYVTKIPNSLMHHSDMAVGLHSMLGNGTHKSKMLSTFAEKMEREYIKMGQDAEFATGLGVLQRQIADLIVSAKSTDGHTLVPLQQDPIGQGRQDIDMSSLDETWPNLWDDDFTNFYTDDTEQNILNMYLLGLPPMYN